MTIEFRCAQCNQLLRVPDTSAGKNARCPKCQLLMQIPATSPPQYAPPPPAGHFAPPPPPAFNPPGYGQPGFGNPGFGTPPPPPPPPNPFDFAGGSPGAPAAPSGSRKGSQFDFLGGPPSPPPSSYPPPPTAPGGFGAPVNPYASPSGGYDPRAASQSAAPKGGRQGLPWERNRHKDFKTYMDTAKLVSFEPGRAFAMMWQRGDMGGPMFFSMWGLGIAALGNMFWSVLFTTLFAASLGAPAEAIATGVMMSFIQQAVIGVLSVALGATLGNFIGAAILHVCLLICGGSKQSFDTSFRIVAFVQGGLAWLNLIPAVGPLILFFWSIGVNIVAVHKAHEVPQGRATMAVLLPIIVICGLFIVLGVLFFSAILAIVSQAQNR